MADSISGMMNFSDIADDAAKVRRDAVSADTTSNMVSSMVKATPSVPSMDYGGLTNQSPPPSVTMGGQSAIDNWKSQAQAVNKGMSNPFREGVGSAPPDFNASGGKAPTPPKPTTTPASSPTASTPSYAPGAVKTDTLPPIDAQMLSPRSPPLPDQGAQIENFKGSMPSQNTGRTGDNDAMGSVLKNLKKVFDSFMPRSKDQKLTGGYT